MNSQMMEMLRCDFRGHELLLLGHEFNGMEELYLDGERVARRRNLFSGKMQFTFSLPDGADYDLEAKVSMVSLEVEYQISRNGEVLRRGKNQVRSPTADKIEAWAEGLNTVDEEGNKGPKPWFSIAGIGFKLFKSGTAVKAALAGGSFAGWALLSDWRFATVLIAILVFHEYGHLRAMRSFNMKTRGMYLIPFFGGVAIGEKSKTYWQETYISMMGPCYGLLMSALAWFGYWLTDSDLLGLIASFSALINLFNLLPVYPLDGGHVVKATALSLNNRGSYVLLIVLSAVGFAASAYFGLFLLSLFIVLGALDLIGSFKTFRENEVIPMDAYGMLISMLWYVGSIVLFVLIIVQMYAAGVPGAEVPYVILTD